jgi:plastocyanin
MPVRKLILGLALVSIVAAIGATVAFARTKSVRLGDNFFSTRTVRIKHGSAVHWHWSRTRNTHNVTGTTKGARFHSRTGHSGDFSHVFKRRGTFKIICTRHPTQMVMTVRVS